MPYILGTQVDDVSSEYALQRIEAFLEHGRGANYIVTPNPEMCLHASGHEDFRRGVLNEAFLSLPDGYGLKIAARIFGEKLKNRVTGIDFTYTLIEHAAKHGWRVFLFGGDEGVAEECKNVFRQRYPGVKIVGTLKGDMHVDTILDTINSAEPDIVLVALGSPLQEEWVREHTDTLHTARLAIGVGGTFDFIAGRKKRAPLGMRRIGLEWVWRLVHEPRRYKRIYNATLKFLFTVLVWRVRMLFVYRRNVVGLVIRSGSGPARRSFSVGGRSSVVERLLPKQKIAGSSPVARSILIVEREDDPGHWQLPQGGVDTHETAVQAIKREMEEELGTNKFKFLKHIPEFFAYEWPKLDQLRRGYHGQRQDLFILEFLGKDEHIKLDTREHVSFKWVSMKDALDTVHPLRKKQMQKALTHLS